MRKDNKEQLAKIIKESFSNREVLFKLGLKEGGGNYETVKKLIIKFELDNSHFTGELWCKGKTFLTDDRIRRKYSLDDIFCNESYVGNYRARKIILSEGLIPYKCLLCENIGEWMGKKLTLELDHINGDNLDNRLENLQFLCPNCHGQTDTYKKNKR